MKKGFVIFTVLLLISSQCSTFHTQLSPADLYPIHNIMVDTIDEKGHVSIYVPPELAGVSMWGSSVTVTMEDFDNASLEQAVHHTLGDWRFENKLYQSVYSQLADKCKEFNVIDKDTVAIKNHYKKNIFENPAVIANMPVLKSTLKSKKIDALLLLKIRYYGPHTKNAFASCKLKCLVDIKLIKISDLTTIWKHSIHLDKLKSDDLLFHLTMEEYLEGECRILKKSLEKAAEVIGQEIKTRSI